MTELFSRKFTAQVRYCDVFRLLRNFRPPDPQLPVFSQKIIPLVGLRRCVVLWPAYSSLLGRGWRDVAALWCLLSLFHFLYNISYSSPSGAVLALPRSMSWVTRLSWWLVFTLAESVLCGVGWYAGFFVIVLGCVCVDSQYWKIPRLFWFNFGACYVEQTRTRRLRRDSFQSRQ